MTRSLFTAALLPAALRFGLALGLVVGMVLALVMTAWNWAENPSGIFRGPDGTQWSFVADTAVSWLVPTFAYVAPAAALGYGLLHRLALARQSAPAEKETNAR
jgi:hypothetical protein